MKKVKKEILFIAILVLVGLASFGLGRLSVLEGSRDDSHDVQFIIPELSRVDMSFKGFNYVASINGTKYYPRGCKSANRIKTENRIYFQSSTDAQKSGFEYTTTC